MHNVPHKQSVSLSDTDSTGAMNATAPRVSLSDLKAKIKQVYYVTGDMALAHDPIEPDDKQTLSIFTVCFMVMKNGFVMLGQSAPASAANYNKGMGELFAYEDAMRKLWPLAGYALRERLAADEGR